MAAEYYKSDQIGVIAFRQSDNFKTALYFSNAQLVARRYI